MKIKLIKTEDFYETMKEWWDKHDFTHVSPSMLPENTFVVYNNKGVPTHSICFYNTDSELCWLGFPISNKEVEEKQDCFYFLMKGVEKYAKKLGYRLLFTTSENPAVQHILTKSNYVIGDINVNHYIKII